MAAPAFDGASSDGGRSGTVSSSTWSHTVTSNTNGLLTVCAGDITVPRNTVTGVTYNGVAMTKATDGGTDVNQYLSLWYLKLPATGAHNVVVTYSGTNLRTGAGAVSFTGVDQTTPISNTAAIVNGTGANPGGSVTSASGNASVDCFYSGNPTGAGVLPTSNQTLRWAQWDNSSGDNSGQASSTSTNPTFTWTLDAGAGGWTWTGMNLNAVATTLHPIRHLVIH